MAVCATGIISLLPFPARSQFINGQDASQVIGQVNFTDSGSNPLDNPRGIAIDPLTGKLFVGDQTNNRVVRYANVDSLATGAQPEAAIGQPDLTTTTPGTTASKIDSPTGIFLDSSGALWVSDRDNERVLRFPNAASVASGSSADLVLGQADFVTSGAGLTASKMSSPEGVFLDNQDNLWVADAGNRRVLRFDNATGSANGANADGVLGQPNFVTNAVNTTQDGFNDPTGVAVTPSGTLFISEDTNDRVMVFINAALKTNGDLADSVIGQPDFTDNTNRTQIFGFSSPESLALSPTGVLAVGSTSNQRAVFFNNPESLFGLVPAIAVIGKPFFTTSTPNTAAQNILSDVYGLVYDPAGRLFVADDDNNRVLRFDPTSLEPKSFQPSISTSSSSKSKAIFKVSNSGPMAADFSLTAKFKIKGGKAKVRLVYNGTNIKPAAKNGTALTGVLPPNGVAKIVVRAKKKSSSGPGSVRIRTKLTARSVAYPNLVDVVAQPTTVD